jgi:hypothetical protein
MRGSKVQSSKDFKSKRFINDKSLPEINYDLVSKKMANQSYVYLIEGHSNAMSRSMAQTSGR